jgi:hypothetical protein
MYPYFNMRFERMARDSSIEASVHRWVARLESPTVSVQRAPIYASASRSPTEPGSRWRSPDEPLSMPDAELGSAISWA